MQQSTEKSIFLNALDIAALEDREAYLSSVCGDDATLRESVDALLSAHEQTLNPLDNPVVEEGALVAGGLDPTTAVALQKSSDEIGKSIGAYRLMELIGEGGFGLVYGAQQERPVRRRVALKIIKPGTGSSEVLARFEAERQAIAMMDHPNIAQVFDAGVTDDSRPYFVMELVRGVPIAEFCHQTELSLSQKLELFADVCSAVHHAHQKGIIHRDLKPSNVLVTLHDTKPVAKVIDFGVAKAMGPNLTDKTIYTRLYSMIGTPLYMSPEQASMSALDVDTRSDVYSLGVMLYELLTGTTPFDRRRLDTAGFDEMRRIIQEEEPPKPSARLTTVDKKRALTLLADQRGSTGRSRKDDLDPDQSRTVAAARKRDKRNRDSIPSDLDWIVMKAMDKDRGRRYQSAAEMGTDLRRFLAQEPIAARPPSKAYLLSKFARRHRVALLAGSLVAFALIIGSGASLYQASKAIEERNEKQEALAELEAFNTNLKKANALIGSAKSYEDSQRWDSAFADYSEAVDIVPSYYLVWVHRGKLLIDLKLWDEAAKDFASAVQLDAPIDGPQWSGVPALLAYTNHDSELESMRSMLLKPTGEEGHSLDWNAIRGAVAAPGAEVDYVSLAAQAEQLLASSQSRTRRGGMGGTKDPLNGPWSGRPRPNEPDSNRRMDGPPEEFGDGRGGFGDGRDGFGGRPRGETGRRRPPQQEGFDSERRPPDRRGGPGFDGPGFDGPRFDRPEFGNGPEFGGRGRQGANGPGTNGRGMERPGMGGPGRRGPGVGGPGPGGRQDRSRAPFLPVDIQYYVAGWAQLRAGNYERALAHLEFVTTEFNRPSADQVHSLIALAHHGAGRDDLAAEALAKAGEVLDRKMDELDPTPNSLEHWFDFVELMLCYREATFAITGKLPRVDARLIAVQQDARSLISEP